MQHIELNGQVREAGNKAAVKAIRREGQVPCNIYGHGMENILFTIDAKDLKTITHTPNSYIIDLKLSDGRSGYAVLHEAVRRRKRRKIRRSNSLFLKRKS